MSDDPRTVLVADDDEDILQLVSFRLERAGYTVVTAADGPQALAAAREHQPDLAVLDVHLNGRSVFDFADRLSAEGVPFVFATGYGERGIPERHRTYPVLQKPFQPEELRRALERVLRDEKINVA